MTNYHTHTYRCRHAEGDVADYVAEARRAGLSVLGFADHVPFPDDSWPETRMSMDEAEGYLDAVDEAKAAEAEKPGGMAILSGFECEWRSEFRGYLADLCPVFGLDYLVGGAHWYPLGGEWLPSTHITQARQVRAFADYQVELIRSGLFAFLAHPDIFCARLPAWDAEAVACSRAILAAAADCGLPLELNGYGLRKPYSSPAGQARPQYPFRPFWELAAEYGVQAIACSDAHRPADVAASIAEARAFGEACGVRVLDSLDLLLEEESA